MSVNKVILVGRVGNDPEIKYIKEDVPVAKFSLATNERYKTRDGEKREDTEWHNIVIWRGLAKVVETYVKKGDQLYLEGKITTRQYEKDGQTKYFTEIVAREMQMLGGADRTGNTTDSGAASKPVADNKTAETKTNDENFDEVDDLPF
ncbi:MAG: single-stranded DNA-binding protein [Bacteroidota bacterium]|nr:single-stranded DNA-binding protein [Bacteroidota bacterium]